MKNILQKSVWMMALCFIATSVCAQVSPKKFKKAKGIEVTYQSSYKGKVRPGQMLMKVNGDQVALEAVRPKMDPQMANKPRPENDARPRRQMPITKSYMDYSANEYYNWASLPSGDIISSAKGYEMGKDMKVIGQEKYLGLNCTIVRTSVRSNTIEIWYTNDLAFRGTPQPGVGVPDGLVLRVIRNGDTVQEAVAINPVKEEQALLPETWGKKMIAEVYQYTINHSNVITVPVFNEENVGFTGAKIPETLEDNVSYNVAGGTILLKKVKLPEYVKDRSIFVELIQWSDGDAYDRTGSVFVIPTDKKQSFLDMLRDLKSVPAFKSGNEDFHGLVSTDNYNVPLELMRFFTGFGVRQYNHNIVPGQEWSDSVLYKTEVTALADRLQGEVWVGAYIGNWDAKGHKVTLKFKYCPDDNRRMYKVMPLFNTTNYMEQQGQNYPTFLLNDKLNAKFTLKEPVKNAVLYYTTTGHGGWGGGDEFNQKPNTIYLDGEKVISFVPWRDDCGTYRNWNPCSGNFSNGLSSSDLSRSNWCPGTVTNPEYIYLGDLEAGEHTITVAIPQGAPEGGSNSYWCLSGTLLY